MELRRGDLIEVTWVDILEDLTGDPDQAEVATRVSIGYFWDCKNSVFVTTTVMDEGLTGQNGFCAYPVGVITHIKMIRRGKGKVYRGRIPYVFTELAPLGADSGNTAGSGGPKKQRRTPALRGGVVSEPVNVQEVPPSGGLP